MECIGVQKRGCKKIQLWSDLNALDAKEEVIVLSEEEKLEKARLQTEFKKTSLLEEISWRQKSRMLYLKELFFHQMANSHRRNNAITNLKVDGVLTSDQKSIGVCIIRFYKIYRPHPDVLNFPKISDDKASRLVRPFDDVEVFGVVKDFEGDKAPGPNDFPMAFFQACWDVIKSNLKEIFQVLFERGQFEKSLNATFISLIPKKSDAVEVKDFQLISLIGGFTKLLLKYWLIG